MKNIRVLGINNEGYGWGTLRIFKENEMEKAIDFMRNWIKYGGKNERVYAFLYEDGKQKKFIKGFKKVLDNRKEV